MQELINKAFENLPHATVLWFKNEHYYTHPVHGGERVEKPSGEVKESKATKKK